MPQPPRTLDLPLMPSPAVDHHKVLWLFFAIFLFLCNFFAHHSSFCPFPCRPACSPCPPSASQRDIQPVPVAQASFPSQRRDSMHSFCALPLFSCKVTIAHAAERSSAPGHANATGTICKAVVAAMRPLRTVKSAYPAPSLHRDLCAYS